MAKGNVERDSVHCSHNAWNLLRGHMLNASRVSEKVDKVTVIPILPVAGAVCEAQAATVEHEQVSVTGQAYPNAGALAFGRELASPLWEIGGVVGGPSGRKFNEADKRASRRHDVRGVIPV